MQVSVLKEKRRRVSSWGRILSFGGFTDICERNAKQTKNLHWFQPLYWPKLSKLFLSWETSISKSKEFWFFPLQFGTCSVTKFVDYKRQALMMSLSRDAKTVRSSKKARRVTLWPSTSIAFKLLACLTRSCSIKIAKKWTEVRTLALPPERQWHQGSTIQRT